MADGVEIKLFDPQRERAHWTDVLLLTQYAAIFKGRDNMGAVFCER